MWNVFFEEPSTGTSEDEVFGYCQYRPRDVLIYVASALESAQAQPTTKSLLETFYGSASVRRSPTSKLNPVTFPAKSSAISIVANHSSVPFRQMFRQQYGATQIICECKNYKDLTSNDFHQVLYYMNDKIGRAALLMHRGSSELKRTYLEHIRRICSDKHGTVLLLGERDLEIFLRQALNGKKSEGHLQDIFDRIVREIS